ncbi:MAG: DUF4232 domain-containing protein [Actinoallomurus sp.]
MEFKRLRIITILACGGGMAALALTGCDANGKLSSSAASSSPDSSRSPSVAASVKSGGDKGGKTRSAGQSDTPSCMAGQLHADLRVQNSNSEEKGIGTLILTNRSGESCFIPAGWAPIGTGGRNNYTPLPATRTNYPGSGRTITLRPGTSAFAGMRWHTGTGCGTTTGLGVAWNSSWIPLTYVGLGGRRPPICDSLVLGTIQPTMNGVNFT